MVAWNGHIIILVCEKYTLMAISSVNNLFFKGQMELTSLIFDSHEVYSYLNM